MHPIGLVLPITRGASGYFNQSYDTMTQIKSNIINLLRTNTGERRMQPKFSGGIRELLFEQVTQNTEEVIKKTIEDRIKRWIPGVNVEKISLTVSDGDKDQLKDTYIIYIKIQFSVNDQIDTVSLDFVSSGI